MHYTILPLAHLVDLRVHLALQRLWATAGGVSLSVGMQSEVTVLASVPFPLAVTCAQEMG